MDTLENIQNYTDVDSHVGARLAEFRRVKDLSQSGLAKEIGVSYQQVQKYETGRNRISASRLWRICIALDLMPNDFFEDLMTPVNVQDIHQPAQRRIA